MSDFLDFLPSKDPVESLISWYEDALKIEDNPYYFTLSTVGLDGSPNARTLLIKEISNDRILFFTNYNSLKAREIENNNNVALTFYWHKSGRQVRLKGKATKVDESISKEYFLSRPFESQLASFISKQSLPVESRKVLVDEFNLAREKYKDTGLECPKFWGGYCVELSEITFFIYGDHRLNNRFKFTKLDQNWKDERLYP